MATEPTTTSPLALTTLRSIRLFGLATNEGGQALALDLARARPGQPKINYQNSPHFFGRKYCAEQPPVNLPSDPLPGDVRATVDLKIGDLIWRNERHAVYNVDVLRLDPPVFYVPPLVIKVAISEPEGRGDLLAEEAGMYGHIEKLQGVVAPRCYGYFSTTDIESGTTWFFDPPPAPATMVYWGKYAMRTACRGMEILLLEKVGEHLPSGQPVSQQVEDDLRDMHYDLAELYVDYWDWRAANLIYAPPSPPGLPGTPSPFLRRPYTLRLIDFEGAMVTNTLPDHQRKVIVAQFLDELLFEIERC